MKITKEVLLISIVLLVAFIYMQSSPCANKENYKRAPLSQLHRMKRSPVDQAFEGDGFSANPHYQANPTDELVPLDSTLGLDSAVDFYADQRRVNAGGAFDVFEPGYTGRGAGTTFLPNDSKTRTDMVDAGDMAVHRFLINSAVGGYAVSPSASPTIGDLSPGPRYGEGLYHDSYHTNDPLGN